MSRVDDILVEVGGVLDRAEKDLDVRRDDWWHPPAADSSLGELDAQFAEYAARFDEWFGASWVAANSVATAHRHIGLAYYLDSASPLPGIGGDNVNSTFVLLRCALENMAMAWWVFMEDDAMVQKRRVLVWWLGNETNRLIAVDGLNHREAEKNAEGALRAVARAVGLGDSKLEDVSYTVKIKAVQERLYESQVLVTGPSSLLEQWQVSSGLTHSKPWADDFLLSKPDCGNEWAATFMLDVATAFEAFVSRWKDLAGAT